MKYKRNLGERYTPLFFLNACAAGGLALIFLLYLSRLSDHNAPSILSFLVLRNLITSGGGIPLVVTGLCGAGFLFFAYEYVQLLLWNVRHYKLWQRTAAFTPFQNGPHQAMLAAIPLSFSLGLHLLCLAAGIFVPTIFEYSDFLSPLAFIALGFLVYQTGMISFSSLLKPLLQEGQEGTTPPLPHPFGLALCLLAFAMIGLDFSTLALFSHTVFTALIGTFGTLFCLLSMAFIIIGPGLPSLRRGLMAGPTAERFHVLLLLLCLAGLSVLDLYRLQLCMIHSFSGADDPIGTFLLWSLAFLSLGLIALLACATLPNREALRAMLTGKTFSAGAYSLVLACLSILVTGEFLINDALAQMGTIERDGILYWLFYGLFAAFHAVAIYLFLKLNKKLFYPVKQSKEHTP